MLNTKKNQLERNSQKKRDQNKFINKENKKSYNYFNKKKDKNVLQNKIRWNNFSNSNSKIYSYRWK